MEKYFGLAKELMDKGLAREIESYDENNTYDTAIQFTDDLEFYIRLAKKQGGKVLDIGCGTGRVMLPLLQAGIEVQGMDLSAHMLSIAADKLSKAGFSPALSQGDMQNFSIPQEFKLIIIPYYAMIYMTSDQERSSVLECCHRHLAPGGVFAFDFDAGINPPGLSKPWLGFEKVDPDGTVTIQTAQMNQVQQDLRIINMITYRFQGVKSRIDVNASIEASIPTARMRELLEEAGFVVKGFYRDYQYTPYSDGEECIVIAEKR